MYRSRGTIRISDSSDTSESYREPSSGLPRDGNISENDSTAASKSSATKDAGKTMSPESPSSRPASKSSPSGLDIRLSDYKIPRGQHLSGQSDRHYYNLDSTALTKTSYMQPRVTEGGDRFLRNTTELTAGAGSSASGRMQTACTDTSSNRPGTETCIFGRIQDKPTPPISSMNACSMIYSHPVNATNNQRHTSCDVDRRLGDMCYSKAEEEGENANTNTINDTGYPPPIDIPPKLKSKTRHRNPSIYGAPSTSQPRAAATEPPVYDIPRCWPRLSTTSQQVKSQFEGVTVSTYKHRLPQSRGATRQEIHEEETAEETGEEERKQAENAGKNSFSYDMVPFRNSKTKWEPSTGTQTSAIECQNQFSTSTKNGKPHLQNASARRDIREDLSQNTNRSPLLSQSKGQPTKEVVVEHSPVIHTTNQQAAMGIPNNIISKQPEEGMSRRTWVRKESTRPVHRTTDGQSDGPQEHAIRADFDIDQRSRSFAPEQEHVTRRRRSRHNSSNRPRISSFPSSFRGHETLTDYDHNNYSDQTLQRYSGSDSNVSQVQSDSGLYGYFRRRRWKRRRPSGQTEDGHLLLATQTKDNATGGHSLGGSAESVSSGKSKHRGKFPRYWAHGDLLPAPGEKK